MQESDLCAACTLFRLLLEEPHTMRSQLFHASADIPDTECDVMHPFTACLDEFSDRAICSDRLEQFQFDVAGIQERNGHLLLGNRFSAEQFQAQCMYVIRKRIVHVFHGNPDVIHLFQSPTPILMYMNKKTDCLLRIPLILLEWRYQTN